MLDINQIETFYPGYLRPFKRNLLREYMQYKILEIIFNSEFGSFLTFMGGTAAHIIHGNTRFSEDLDFDNLGLTIAKFKKLSAVIEKQLKREGYAVEYKSTFKNAYVTHLRIPRVLYDNKLSPHEKEVLLIKIDTEPQEFKYPPEKVILNKFDVFLRINVVPVDILLSQKLYAVFGRKRPMGRDFYDSVFLIGKTKPNLAYLKAKLDIKDGKDLKDRLLKKCEALNFKQLAGDVEQFIFAPSDAKKILLFREYIEAIDF